MGDDWPIVPYPSAPSTAERLARVEERLGALAERVDGMARTMRWSITAGIALAAAIGPVIVEVVK